MQSIVSYPDRGKWGNNKYRGNCTGHIIYDLLQFFRPKMFVEIFAGGGTGLDVAQSMGITNSIHLDLNGQFGDPFDVLIDELPQGSDFVFSHPPYHSMIQYSGNMWGEPHPDDLSRCATYSEFIQKMNKVNAKIYNSLRNGGRHAMLIGDMRKNGTYYSMMKDLAWYGELESHIIKAQHNFQSQNQNYSGSFIPIVHEHLLIFRKNDIWAIPITFTGKTVKSLKESRLATWRDLVQAALQSLSGKASLAEIYNLLQDTDKAKKNPHFKEKIRQILQLHKEFTSIGRGVWSLV